MTPPPLIIIEGPDCTGKTTLSRYLARVFTGAFLFHATAQGKLPLAMTDYQLNILENARVAMRELSVAAILDRHWPSEMVYGQIFRPGNPHGFYGDTFARAITEMRGIYIFCDRPDVIEAHSRERDPEHPYDEDKFAQVVSGYRELRTRLHQSGAPLLEYDLTIWGDKMHEFTRLIQAKNYELHGK